MRAAYSFIHSLSSVQNKSGPVIALSRYQYAEDRRRVVFHSRYVIGVLKKGVVNYKYNGFTNKMEPGYLYLFQPNSLIVDQAGEPASEVEYYHIDIHAVRWILEGLSVSEDALLPLHRITVDSSLNDCLKDLSTVLQFRKNNSDLQSEILINMLDLLLEGIERQRIESDPAIVSREEMMTAKLKLIRFGSWAHMSGASVMQFIHEFGATPEEVIAAVQAERARSLLECGVPTGQVAGFLGIGDTNRLDDLFSRAWLLSSQDYQNMALGTGR